MPNAKPAPRSARPEGRPPRKRSAQDGSGGTWIGRWLLLAGVPASGLLMLTLFFALRAGARSPDETPPSDLKTTKLPQKTTGSSTTAPSPTVSTTPAETAAPVVEPAPTPADRAAAISTPPARKADSEYADCSKIGTRILFHRDPTAAFARARVENTLVFVVHLSGNFEDDDFT